jgi:hypothetical protein
LAVLLFAVARRSALLSASGDVTATTFLTISAVGVPFVLVTLASQGVLRGKSDYVTPLWILLASNVANVLIDRPRSTRPRRASPPGRPSSPRSVLRACRGGAATARPASIAPDR